MFMMSLQTTITLFITCMAPLFLVFFVVDGIHMLQFDKTTYVSGKSESDASANFKCYVVLCVACVVPCAVLSMYIAMYGRRERAGEHAR